MEVQVKTEDHHCMMANGQNGVANGDPAASQIMADENVTNGDSKLTDVVIKEEEKINGKNDHQNPDFVLTTKNLERVKEELRQEEILQGRKSPFKSETASPIKLPESVSTYLKTASFQASKNALFADKV